MWTIFQVFIESVTILLLFHVLVFWPWGMWDLSSPTMDLRPTPCIGRWSLNHRAARESESHSVMSDSLRPHGPYNQWNSPGQNTGVGSLSLLQGIFPTQESNPGSPHCRQILYQLSHKGSPRILEWVAYPFFLGSSWPRNPTMVSCITGGFFTNWVLREAPGLPEKSLFIPLNLSNVLALHNA